jgi:hypothetical protein
MQLIFGFWRVLNKKSYAIMYFASFFELNASSFNSSWCTRIAWDSFLNDSCTFLSRDSSLSKYSSRSRFCLHPSLGPRAAYTLPWLSRPTHSDNHHLEVVYKSSNRRNILDSWSVSAQSLLWIAKKSSLLLDFEWLIQLVNLWTRRFRILSWAPSQATRFKIST